MIISLFLPKFFGARVIETGIHFTKENHGYNSLPEFFKKIFIPMENLFLL